MTNAVQNFEEISRQVIESAKTPKAAAFAEKVASDIRAKGADWIARNADALKATFVPSQNTFPVSDNRLYYLAAFQMALIECA